MANYRITTFGHMISGEQFNWTWHGVMVTGQAAVIATRAADAVTLMWNGVAAPADDIKQLYDNGTVVDGVKVDELDNLGKNVSQSVAALALAGTGVAEALPPQVAVCVSLRTVLPTRGGRGRFFLPAPIVSVLNSQLLSSSARAIVLAAAGAALDHMNGLSGFDIAVYHRDLKTATSVIRIDVGNVLDTQRRRRNHLVESRILHTLV